MFFRAVGWCDTYLQAMAASRFARIYKLGLKPSSAIQALAASRFDGSHKPGCKPFWLQTVLAASRSAEEAQIVPNA